ncbi:unnamed protein product [Euphydryas editha]|uniref:Uncharacterized protein n=1 Tax=Euphydryas editha TaxID=104508 RepID=A0AAU9UMC5_EUPED|nr:unnamed protein product [Euphydryas editha]
MNKIVFLLLVVCLCQSIDAFCALRYVESYTCPAPSCLMRGCEPYMSPCAKSYPCDGECECLKALMRFPEVEYPMPVFEYRPYCCGCTR